MMKTFANAMFLGAAAATSLQSFSQPIAIDNNFVKSWFEDLDCIELALVALGVGITDDFTLRANVQTSFGVAIDQDAVDIWNENKNYCKQNMKNEFPSVEVIQTESCENVINQIEDEGLLNFNSVELGMIAMYLGFYDQYVAYEVKMMDECDPFVDQYYTDDEGVMSDNDGVDTEGEDDGN